MTLLIVHTTCDHVAARITQRQGLESFDLDQDLYPDWSWFTHRTTRHLANQGKGSRRVVHDRYYPVFKDAMIHALSLDADEFGHVLIERPRYRVDVTVQWADFRAYYNKGAIHPINREYIPNVTLRFQAWKLKEFLDSIDPEAQVSGCDIEAGSEVAIPFGNPLLTRTFECLDDAAAYRSTMASQFRSSIYEVDEVAEIVMGRRS